MNNDAKTIELIEVEVKPIPAAAAASMRGASICCCRDCAKLLQLLTVAEGETLTRPGKMSVIQCVSLFKLAIFVRCDVCLMYAQQICRSVGDAVGFATALSAGAKHKLEQSHAFERDRLDSARVGVWFELALSCKVGAKRAAELYRVAISKHWSLGKYVEPYCDEFGLSFTIQMSDAVDRAAVDFLIAIDERDWHGKPDVQPRQDA